MTGHVSLVGAGPGDPGLITVAGLDRIRHADVIVYDRLVGKQLLDYARPDAELIYAGKIPGHVAKDGDESTSQDVINQALIDRAREGKRVVRLKGGDPFVFGRGSEEAEALRAAGIPFDVVPGITSAIAVPAYAGIPVTHRGVATSFAVITGHEAPDKEESQIDWPALAHAADTLVFLMGVKNLPDITANLLANGRPASTPVAVIRWGTTPEQRTVTGTLADIAVRVAKAGITPPAITIVGEVVALRETVSWFETRPLFGKRVLITRTRRQASHLAKLLAERGAIPIELPAIEIEPLDAAPLSAAIDRLRDGSYTWCGFTSANAVDLFFEHLAARHLDARTFAGAKVFAIGPATAAALRTHGITADVVPTEYVAEALIDALSPSGGQASSLTEAGVGPGDHILLPRAEDARPELVAGLQRLGATIDEVPIYRAALPANADPEALAALREGLIDIVTFTSSSTVRNLLALLGDDTDILRDNAPAPVILSADHAGSQNNKSSRREPAGGNTPERSQRPVIACIGPITAQTARESGLTVDVSAEEYTVEGLVASLIEYAAGQKTKP